MNQLYVAKRDQWRQWLSRHHATEAGIWLVFYKKGAGEQSLDYGSALDEALCYSWIDSIFKKIDDTKYARKFTGTPPAGVGDLCSLRMLPPLRDC